MDDAKKIELLAELFEVDEREITPEKRASRTPLGLDEHAWADCLVQSRNEYKTFAGKTSDI